MWLFISGFADELYSPLNLSISGLIALGISLFGILIRKKKRAIVIGIIGIWLIFNGAILNNTAPYNFILFGFIIAFLGTSCVCSPIEIEGKDQKSYQEKLKDCFKFNKN
jgi:hypothetical protein